MAVREFVVLDEPLRAQRVEGAILDPVGASIPNVTVSDCERDGKAVLRTTKADAEGHFSLPRQSGKSLYYLRFDTPAFNPLGLKLQLDRNSPHRGIVAQPEVGG